MEQASISSRLEELSFPRAMTAITAFLVAIGLVVYMMTSVTDLLKVDRVMTDEVQKIKVGYTVSGDPKPHGGLPELKQQIGDGDFAAAGKTLDGLGRHVGSVKSELERRATGSAALAAFSGQLDQVRQAVNAQDKGAAEEAVKAAPGLWSPVQDQLSQTSIDTGVLGRSLGLFALVWALLTAGLVLLWDKGRPNVASAAEGDKKGRGLDLTRIAPFKAAMASPIFPASIQAFSLVFLIMIIVVGVVGSAATSESLTSVLVWSLWWSPLMMVTLVLFGKMWCGACPLGAITAVIERFGAARRSPSFGRRAKLGFLTLTPMFATLIGFVAMREPLFGSGYAVTSAKPVWTVVYFGVFIGLAVIVSLVYKRRAWCRYWCPVSAATTVVGKLSPIDLAQDRHKGVSNCSTMEYPGNYLTSDKRCLYCFKCTQAYPNTPVRARLRLPGSAIVRERHIFGEAVMSLIMVAVFPIGHGLGQIAFFKGSPQSELRLGYFTAIIGSLLAFAAISRVSAGLSKLNFSDSFARFGVAYLPIGALFALAQAISGIMGKSGNWLNATLPVFGINGYWPAAIVESATLASWKAWSMSWMAAIGGVWALLMIWGIARRHKSSVGAWLPHVLLVIGFIVLAKVLPMPTH